VSTTSIDQVTDSAPAPAVRRRLPWGRIVLTVYAMAGVLYLFVPIIYIVAFSFNEPRGRFNLVWQGFTFDNWLDPFANEELTEAMMYSLRIAAISMVAATILGSLIAIALSRYRFKGGSLIDLVLVLPLTTPEIVLGASLATLFLDIGLQKGTMTILIAHIMFSVSFVALTVKARIRGFDWALEDAAGDLGASPLRAFWTVTFPLIFPGIVAAGLLSFALSLDDFIITFFTAGSQNTFPIQVYGGSRNGTPPQINVLATMVLLASIAIIGLSAAWNALRIRR
jgi:spermidine/putrescine transport system permease protein